MYTTFKYELEPERYLDSLNIRKYLVAFSRLRCSNHVLEIERGRHANLNMADRVCTLCQHSYILEDEFHFIMQCTAYRELRKKYIDPHILPDISDYDNFIHLVQSSDDVVQDIACCTYYNAFRLRRELKDANQ